MKDFNRGGGFNNRGGDRGGRGSFGGGNRGGFGGDRGGRGSFGAPQMHKTTCSDCGGVAEVPFKPNGDKPVLCSDCFGGNRDSGRGNDRGGDRGGDRRDSRSNDRGDRVFGSREKAPQTGGSDLGKIKDEISKLNQKIDALVVLLGGSIASEKTEVKKEATVEKIAKREKPKAGELKEVVKKAVATTKEPKKAVKKTAKKAVKKTSKK